MAGKIYDAVVVGSGAGAGPVIYTLAKAGWEVLVLEKGPWLRTADFRKDELVATRRSVYTPPLHKEFHVLSLRENGRWNDYTTYALGWDFWNGNMVGGSSNLMSGYFHRLKPVDFRLRSVFGDIPGANVEDWPIDYADLEPYYALVERVVGVSGRVVPHRFQEPRSTADFPYPPLDENAVSGLIDRAAAETGLEVIPTPRAILSRPEGERKSCYYSNYCGSYGCASDAKGSSRVALIREALLTGNCTVITGARVFALESDGHHRIRKAHYLDPQGRKYSVSGKLFVVAAQAVETVRLMLMSRNAEYPDGIGNRYGQVGKNLLFSAGGVGSGDLVAGDFDADRFRELMRPGLFVNRSMQHFYTYDDPSTGRRGKGGTVDFLFEHANPVPRALRRMWDGDRLLWGEALKKRVHEHFTRRRRLQAEIFVDWLPNDDCFVDLDPHHKDARGLPVARIRLGGHEANLKPARFLARQTRRIFEAMGLKDIRFSISNDPPANLQAGGMRFGTDPRRSVLDPYCRVHDADNLYVTDGSFMPTGGSVPYTWTIYANAFRVAEHLVALGKK